MLIVTRKTNESITIEPLGNVDPKMTLEEAFRDGPIEIRLIRINRSRVRLAVDAPPVFQVWRGRQAAPALAPMNSVKYEPAEVTVDFGLAAKA